MAGEPTRELVQRFAQACADAYRFTGVAKRQASSENSIAIVSGRAGPDWSSLVARAGRQISVDLRAQELSQDDLDAVRAGYGGEG